MEFEMDVNIDIVSSDISKHILNAVKNNSTGELKQIIDLNQNVFNDISKYVFYTACMFGQFRTVTFAYDYMGNCPTYILMMGFKELCKINNIRAVEWIIERDIRILENCTEDFWTSLCFCGSCKILDFFYSKYPEQFQFNQKTFNYVCCVHQLSSAFLMMNKNNELVTIQNCRELLSLAYYELEHINIVKWIFEKSGIDSQSFYYDPFHFVEDIDNSNIYMYMLTNNYMPYVPEHLIHLSGMGYVEDCKILVSQYHVKSMEYFTAYGESILRSGFNSCRLDMITYLSGYMESNTFIKVAIDTFPKICEDESKEIIQYIITNIQIPTNVIVNGLEKICETSSIYLFRTLYDKVSNDITNVELFNFLKIASKHRRSEAIVNFVSAFFSPVGNPEYQLMYFYRWLDACENCNYGGSKLIYRIGNIKTYLIEKGNQHVDLLMYILVGLFVKQDLKMISDYYNLVKDVIHQTISNDSIRKKILGAWKELNKYEFIEWIIDTFHMESEHVDEIFVNACECSNAYLAIDIRNRDKNRYNLDLTMSGKRLFINKWSIKKPLVVKNLHPITYVHENEIPDCPLCLENKCDIVTTCLHTFCKDCIKKMSEFSTDYTTCAMCRTTNIEFSVINCQS